LLLPRSPLAARLASKLAYGRHVFAIPADGNTAFSSSLASLLRGELVSVSSLMSYLAPLARDEPLLVGVHRREPAWLLRGLLLLLRHNGVSLR
jgi:hypothetical protein